MRKILCFDTETTDLVKLNLAPDHPSQPHLVQLGAILADEAFNELAAVELVVKPSGYSIPERAVEAHGITTEKAAACGLPLLVVLAVFTNLRAIADELVAYNLPFDDLVMRAAIHRSGRAPAHPGPTRRTCAMTLATPLVNLPPTAKMVAAGFGDKPKFPNLTEAHTFFTGEGFSGAHSALADARACLRVYRAILAREAAA